MTQVPLWVAYLQALATPAIALLAAAIAYGQWKTAQQKFVQDLFDRRFAVFMDVRALVHDVVDLGVPLELSATHEVLTRARFLFGDDVCAEIRGIGTALESYDYGAVGHMPDAVRHTVREHFNRLLPLFESYMRLDQKPPRA